MQTFQDIGAELEAAWLSTNYDERAFPGLAARALRERGVHRELGNVDILRWVTSARALPFQDDLKARFGDPPVTVYHGRRFFIQVLFWREGTTAIHRHGFSGAFQVLEGTSLHTRYAFAPRTRVSSRFVLGDLRLLECGILERGEAVEITNDLAHALFHLERAATTIVVRTYREDDAHPQYSYKPPFLAVDPFSEDPIALRQLQALGFARHMDDGLYLDLAADVIGRSDLHTGYLVLSDMARGPCDGERLSRLLDVARRRHGAVVDQIAAVLHEELRDRRLAALRATLTDPGQRFFLALLASLHEKATILSMVQRRHPDADPHALVDGWIRALSGTDRIGVDLEDELTNEMVKALREACHDDELLARLAVVYGQDAVDTQREGLLRHATRIRRSALGPLFRAATAP